MGSLGKSIFPRGRYRGLGGEFEGRAGDLAPPALPSTYFNSPKVIPAMSREVA